MIATAIGIAPYRQMQDNFQHLFTHHKQTGQVFFVLDCASGVTDAIGPIDIYLPLQL